MKKSIVSAIMFKRHLSSSIILAASLVLSSCGSNNPTAPEQAAATAEPQTQQYCPTGRSKEKSYSNKLHAPEITIHDFLPSKHGFKYSGGTLCAFMTGHGPGDMNLELYKKEGNRWKRVTYDGSNGNKEQIVYRAQAGTYRWAVSLWTSSGKYFVKTRE